MAGFHFVVCGRVLGLWPGSFLCPGFRFVAGFHFVAGYSFVAWYSFVARVCVVAGFRFVSGFHFVARFRFCGFVAGFCYVEADLRPFMASLGIVHDGGGQCRHTFGVIDPIRLSQSAN